MDQKTAPESPERDASSRKTYEKPVLIVHGPVGELTQSGGARRRDGLRTRALS